jgi:pimeloyl-ACP methyl ester carboxylesterase
MTDSTFTLADGRALSYAEYGAPDGTPLFFFHGLPGSRKFAAPFSGDAADLGIRVIAPDRPGFGASTFQPGRLFGDWPADVAALADHLGLDRFFVSGISGGGPYTLACAHALGERVRAGGVISGGGDMSVPGALEGMHDQNRQLFELALSAGAEGVATAMAPMVEMIRNDPDLAMKAAEAGLPAADLELLNRRTDIKDALNADGQEALAQGIEGVAHEVYLFVQPWGFDVAEITRPVVLWHGDDDRNAPLSHAQALADRMPHAELIVWEGMGHLTAIDRVKEIFGHLVEAG